jgi:DNA-binding response OmpR family regulator
VITAKDGFQAVELAFARHPDCILMDVKMPRLNGWEAAQVIRDRDIDVPIIIMTGFSDLLDDRRIRHLDIAACLAKPFELQELKARIRNLTTATASTCGL